ncbi:MAG TPA: hypothetical protein VK009_22485 [Chloroflexota bacterium]|nr:hypothetical protein [Chloroflexota bacterium]
MLWRASWLAALLAAALCVPATAFAAGLGGAIDGQLVDKTPGATLQAGAKAYVYKLVSGQDPQQAGQADVDASGHFRFDGLEADPANSYEVGVQYQGVPYFSDPITFASGETDHKLSLDVYEASDDDSVLSLAGTSLLVDPDEKTHELAILELDSFVNSSQRAFLPNTTPRNGGPPPILRFSLPLNATNLNPGQGMTGDDMIQIPGGFGALVPLPPGRRDLGFTYRSAYQTSSTSFTKSIIYPTKGLRVLMPAGSGQVDSPQLSRQPMQNIGGKQYQLLAASDLQPGAKVELKFSSLPGIKPLSELAQPSTLPWLAGILGLVVLGLMAWYVRDKRRAPVPAPVVDRRQLESERRDLLIALARLDDRFDEGRISSEDYRNQRDAQKAELLEILQQLEALPPEPVGS